MRFKFRSVAYSLLLVALVGCSAQPEFDSVYTQLDTPSLAAGSAIPDPQEDVILTVSGQVGAANEGQTIVMDIPTIESAGLVEYTVEDPFEKEERTFEGVLMKDLLALWQVSPEATVLSVTALNDFQVDVPIELVRDYPVIFALKQDGEYMTPDYRGPAMLVFPYDHYTFDIGSDSYWVWQIKTIEVK
ncbi:MAG: molybdopterin-dependent oxidoreductase [Cyanobacteria bacterium P01_F01_bin.4]